MTQPTENPFFEAGADAILLDELTFAGRTSVLERLGPAGFRSKGFSFIGFLETLYDYIAEQSSSPTRPTPAEATAETVETAVETPGDIEPAHTSEESVACESSVAVEPVAAIETEASSQSETPDSESPTPSEETAAIEEVIEAVTPKDIDSASIATTLDSPVASPGNPSEG